MIYNTGSRDDWDLISRITEDPAWTWDAMAPYRDLTQKYVAPNDGHNDVSHKRACSRLSHSHRSSQTNQYLPSAHSRNGMVSISLPGYTHPTDSRVVAAAAEPVFASQFPFQRDMNTGNTVRFITIASSFFHRPLFLGIDRLWLGTGHHWRWPTLRPSHHLHRAKLC